MREKTKIAKILEQANRLGDRRLSRQIRAAALEPILKSAQQESEGIFQNYRSSLVDYKTREHHTTERGGEDDGDKLYGVGLPEKEKTDLSTREYSRSLSTRYVPSKPGVQARRVSDGVYQDPITNKTYDWNDGFKTEEGEEFGGGRVSLQTDIFSRH